MLIKVSIRHLMIIYLDKKMQKKLIVIYPKVFTYILNFKKVYMVIQIYIFIIHIF